jgi:hypothetical protein
MKDSEQVALNQFASVQFTLEKPPHISTETFSTFSLINMKFLER